jgi:prepilin-type N-terminal cleavage/methylation domain-containing protein
MSELDQKIEQLAKNWKMGRMPIIDRNLLRLSLFEILYQKNTPHSVVINEAVELAKRFGTADSSSFINALLDHAAKEQQQQGFTLIETLIALSILAVIGVAFLQMTDNQRKQFQYFQNKSDLIETKNFLVETFSRPDTCSWQLSSSKTKQFLDIESKQSDGTTLNSEIQLTELRSGISPSSSLLAQVNAPISTRNSPVVDQIKLSKIQQIANNSFEGWLSISFKKSNNGFAYNPISFRKLFSVDVSKPHAAAVLNCN